MLDMDTNSYHVSVNQFFIPDPSAVVLSDEVIIDRRERAGMAENIVILTIIVQRLGATWTSFPVIPA
jgi:hypothetical protein